MQFGHSTESDSFLIAAGKYQPHSVQRYLRILYTLRFRIMAFMLEIHSVPNVYSSV